MEQYLLNKKAETLSEHLDRYDPQLLKQEARYGD